jgi:hypothetical protein
LSEEFCALNVQGFFFEDIDKYMADAPPLFLRLGDAGQRR